VPSTRSDDFLNTVRTTAARPGQVIDVVVLSSDAGLLATLRSSAGSEHALWDVPSADAAVDYLVGGRCDVLIVDLGSFHGNVASMLERLQAQFPELIFMATGRREEEGAVASLLSTGRIYRFLHKPISPGRAFQFLNAATRRYNELGAVQPVALQAVRTIARKRPYLGKTVAAGAGMLAAVVAFTLWLHSGEPGLPATLQTAHVSDAPVADQVKSKLGSAQIAYLSGRLIDPRGDNALQYYRDVLTLDANNADAKAGMQKVIDALEQRVVKALGERSAPRVVTAWTALQRAAPDHPRLEALRAQLLALTRATPKPQTNAAEKDLAEAIARELAEEESIADAPAEEQVADTIDPTAELPEPQEPTLTEQIAVVTRLLESGALISPAGNNAFDSMMSIRERYPDADEVRTEQQRLAFVLLDRARAALAVENVDDAAALIGRADALIPGMQAVRTLQEQLAVAQEKRDFAENVAIAASLKRTREVPPVYPRDAQRAGIEGWVQVEFTIAPDGSTRDLRVRDSAPTQVFDKAALDSVSKWRFEPIRKNGAPVAQRAVLQVRFVLND